jgi:hypothetical protein
LRYHLEELHFSFGEDPLVDVAGLLISEDGCHAIIAATDLDAAARIPLYLHCLGHLALGHLEQPHLTLFYEFRDRWRLPPQLQAREAAADQWARALLTSTIAPLEPSRHRSRARLAELRNLRLPHGFLRACHARLSTALQTASPDTRRRLREAFTAT